MTRLVVRLTMALACLTIAGIGTAACGGIAVEKKPEQIQSTVRFTDSEVGVSFQYPSAYRLIRKRGKPSPSSEYVVSLGGGQVGSKYQSICLVSIGGWGNGRPDLLALTPAKRLRKIGSDILRHPARYVVGNGKLVKLEKCEVVDTTDGPALVWAYTSRENGIVSWNYHFNTFRDDLLCGIAVWGSPDEPVVREAAEVMTSTFSFALTD